jgi:hypothetical protein
MEVRHDPPDFRRRMLAAERRPGNQPVRRYNRVETNLSDKVDAISPIQVASA